MRNNWGSFFFLYFNCTTARELVACDRSTLFLVDQVTNTLWAKVIDGMAPIRLKIGVGIVGASAALRQVINIPDAYNDDRFNSSFDKKSGYHTKSILCVPIYYDNNQGDQQEEMKTKEEPLLIGVMQLINALNNDHFNDDDIAMCQDFCCFISNKLRREDVLPISATSADPNEEEKEEKDTSATSTSNPPSKNMLQPYQLLINSWKRSKKKYVEDQTNYYH